MISLPFVVRQQRLYRRRSEAAAVCNGLQAVGAQVVERAGRGFEVVIGTARPAALLKWLRLQFPNQPPEMAWVAQERAAYCDDDGEIFDLPAEPEHRAKMAAPTALDKKVYGAG